MAEEQHNLIKSPNSLHDYDTYQTRSREYNLQSISYHNISYRVPQIDCCCVKFRYKPILHNVSGILYQGLNAIMGPTGSGKTTLLDVLAARKNMSYLKGHVLLNGEPLPNNFKCTTGYVIQEDLLSGILSIRENIYFSASLRLPIALGAAEKKRRVQQIIDKLGLTHVADSKIGDKFTRGVSGGEKKRCHIGMELVISPDILFLDEPTTGLDAYTAVNLIKQLKELTREGCTIITAIHQPRFAIYKLFDSITLLSKGRTVFHGLANEAVPYFAEIGIQCDPQENPADFFLDTIAWSETKEVTHNCTPYQLVENFANSNINVRLNQRLNKFELPLRNSHLSLFTSGYTTNFFWQIMVVGKRTITTTIRTPLAFFLQIIISIVFNLVIGGLYWQLDLTPSGLQNRIGGLFLIVMNQVFSNLGAIFAFLEAKEIFIHENASGYYRVSSFFFSKLLLDIIPQRLIPNVIGATILYLMMGFQLKVTNFFFFMLTLSLTTAAAAGFPILYGAMTTNFAVANLASALTFVIMMVFGGLLINIVSIPSWLQWLQYLSVFRLSLSSLSINELKGLEFCLDSDRLNNTCNPKGRSFSTGIGYLISQGINYIYVFDLWRGVIGLAGFTFILLLLTYVVLLLIKKDK